MAVLGGKYNCIPELLSTWNYLQIAVAPPIERYKPQLN